MKKLLLVTAVLAVVAAGCVKMNLDTSIEETGAVVVLNACEGARGGKRDIFSSTASILVEQGIPAVLAMQGKVFMKTVAAFLDLSCTAGGPLRLDPISQNKVVVVHGLQYGADLVRRLALNFRFLAGR